MTNASNKSNFKPILAFPLKPLQYCQGVIEQQLQLTAQVRDLLPPEIAAQALHCLISGQRLLIYVDSACWASRIRFYQQSILANIYAPAQQNLTTLQVKLLLSPPPRLKPRKPRLPDPGVLRHWPADGEPGDELARALARLGKVLRRKSENRLPL